MDKNLIPIKELQEGASVENVFVSNEDTYGGAHDYHFKKCLGWDKEKGESKFIDETATISFVRKEESGMVAGIQSEQLIVCLIDRHRKLDAKFPCDENKEFIRCLEEALEWQKSRIPQSFF